MADIAYGAVRAPRKPFSDRMAGFFQKMALANPRVRQMERLIAMSDAELARRGIKRQDIAHHVFRDVMYL